MYLFRFVAVTVRTINVQALLGRGNLKKIAGPSCKIKTKKKTHVDHRVFDRRHRRFIRLLSHKCRKNISYCRQDTGAVSTGSRDGPGGGSAVCPGRIRPSRPLGLRHGGVRSSGSIRNKSKRVRQDTGYTVIFFCIVYTQERSGNGNFS